MNRPGVASLLAVGSTAVHLPAVLARRGCASSRRVDHHARLPVVLVHGFAGTEAVWHPARRSLAAAGFGHIVTIRYNSFSCEPAAVCAELAAEIQTACTVAGAPGVHLIGHSLGGLLVRHLMATSPAQTMVRTAVTIATPHRGTPFSWILPGRCRRILRRPTGAPDLGRSMPSRARWLAYYADHDRIVTPASARLDDHLEAATSIAVPGTGHMTICRHPALLRSLTEELIRTESATPPSLRRRRICAA